MKTGGVMDLLRWEPEAAGRAPVASPAVRLVAAAPRARAMNDTAFLPAPDLDAFEWEEPVVSVAALQRPRPAAPAIDPVPEPVRGPAPALAQAVALAPPDEPGRARIRQRYFSVRFPGAPGSASDGKDPAATIKAARLHFEDGDGERAVELLEFAIQTSPLEPRLWLALLEILFLERESEAFVRAARSFRDRFPQAAEWAEVARLGWRLAPREPAFASGRPVVKAADAHYGAWPEAPNWIEASWDLTAEVLAVELRSRVLRSGGGFTLGA